MGLEFESVAADLRAWWQRSPAPARIWQWGDENE
jgi:hypothetical protein